MAPPAEARSTPSGFRCALAGQAENTPVAPPDLAPPVYIGLMSQDTLIDYVELVEGP